MYLRNTNVLSRGLRLDYAVKQRMKVLEKKREEGKQRLLELQEAKLKAKMPDTIEGLARLTRIRSGKHLVPFELYDYQKLLLHLIDNNRALLGIKSRQMGFTQAIILRFLYEASRNEAYSALVFGQTQMDTSLVAFRCREMIKSLGGLVELANDNLQTLRFVNGGVIYFRNSAIDGARGIDSVSDVLYDEAGFCEDIESTYIATCPCQEMVGDDARTIVLSTPNGQAEWYFDLANSNNPEGRDLLETIKQVRKQEIDPVQYWIDDDGWVKFMAYWRAHPVYGKKDDYLEELAKRRKVPMEAILQEHDLSFEDAVERPFSPLLVRNTCIGEKDETVDESLEYYFGIDTNLMGTDYCVCLVFVYDRVSRVAKVVDWYRNRSVPTNFHVSKISELIDKYKPETVGIETNSAGIMYLEDLEELNPTTYFQGFVTSYTSKGTRICKLSLRMERNLIEFPNTKIFKDEFLSFEKKGNQFGAITGKHDDIVMAATIGNAVLPPLDDTNIDWSKINRY